MVVSSLKTDDGGKGELSLPMDEIELFVKQVDCKIACNERMVKNDGEKARLRRTVQSSILIKTPHHCTRKTIHHKTSSTKKEW